MPPLNNLKSCTKSECLLKKATVDACLPSAYLGETDGNCEPRRGISFEMLRWIVEW